MSKRLRRDQRSPHAPRMVLTERDKYIIKAVADCRILRQDQLQRLFFGSRSTTQYRLAHLYQHRFLNRMFLPVRMGRSPILYVLDSRGADLLRAELGYSEANSKVQKTVASDEFLAHTLAINDVRIAITLACQRYDYPLSTWLGEAEMKAVYDRVEIRLPSGQRRLTSLIPDSYFTVGTPHGTAHFFVELDRGTMTTARFKLKLLAYMAYVASGAYQRRYNTRSLRVLTVTSSVKRLANLKGAAEAANGGRLFWFTTMGAITAEAILSSPIWQVAGESDPHVLIALSS